jgi:hypothetical protein
MHVLLYGMSCMVVGVGLLFLAAGTNTKSRVVGLVLTLMGFVPALCLGLPLAGIHA